MHRDRRRDLSFFTVLPAVQPRAFESATGAVDEVHRDGAMAFSVCAARSGYIPQSERAGVRRWREDDRESDAGGRERQHAVDVRGAGEDRRQCEVCESLLAAIEAVGGISSEGMNGSGGSALDR